MKSAVRVFKNLACPRVLHVKAMQEIIANNEIEIITYFINGAFVGSSEGYVTVISSQPFPDKTKL
jgi:hypothetical protein